MDPQGNTVSNVYLNADNFLSGTRIRPLKKRLIVLDINGFFMDIVSPPPKDREADITIPERAIFLRSYYLEFLLFCFKNFEVGIWSTEFKENVDRAIECSIPFLKNKLLFFWDLSHCTETCFKTLENENKNIVFKDLRKLWDKHDPSLPWKKGYYNESNTLLLDNCPYTALLNPSNTSVFTHKFSYRDENDNSLAKGGELRVYIEGLKKAQDMHKYVEEHPFGQEAITERSKFWNFYSQVIQSLSALAMLDLKRK